MKKFTGYCPLYTKEIAEGLCIEIQAQVDDEIKNLKKQSKISETQIKETCENCPNLITE